LLGRIEFVDRRQNSIDPPSNEFSVQVVEIKGDCTGRHGRLMAKRTIFVVFPAAAGLLANPRVAL
jgi:hypothetical protein